MAAWPRQPQGTGTQPQGLLLSTKEQKHPGGTIPVPNNTPFKNQHPPSPPSEPWDGFQLLPARDMKPQGPCHGGHPQASPQPCSQGPCRLPPDPPVLQAASCRHHTRYLPPSQPSGSPGEVLSFQLLFFCNT